MKIIRFIKNIFKKKVFYYIKFILIKYYFRLINLNIKFLNNIRWES